MLNKFDQFKGRSDGNEASFSNPETKIQKYSRSQKIAVISLAFFAFLAITLWLIQFKQNLSGSMRNQSSIDQTGTGANIEENRDEQLKIQDTDGDGLNDYSELNIYLTSPYLEDSDSDGFSDREESISGNDPNCPVGQECQTAMDNQAGETASSTGNSSNIETLNNMLNQLNQGTGSTAVNQTENTNTVESAFVSQLDAASLRQLLIDKGLDKNLLDQISDEDLVRTFNEVMNEQ